MAATKPTSLVPHLQPRPGRNGVAAAYVLWWLSDQIDFSGDCWVWLAAKTEEGYGIIDLKNYKLFASTVTVHRAVYEICVERIPDGLHVLHSCDNPPCCRPGHLFLGTNDDNIADKMAKGRHNCRRGDEHFHAKMTSEMVLEAHRRRRLGQSFVSIARHFGVSDATVRDAVNGRTWKHLLPKGE